MNKPDNATGPFVDPSLFIPGEWYAEDESAVTRASWLGESAISHGFNIVHAQKLIEVSTSSDDPADIDAVVNTFERYISAVTMASAGWSTPRYYHASRLLDSNPYLAAHSQQWGPVTYFTVN